MKNIPQKIKMMSFPCSDQTRYKIKEEAAKEQMLVGKFLEQFIQAAFE